MIISDQQIAQLMDLATQFQCLLSLIPENNIGENQFNCIDNLLNTIANQQSHELKAIK